MIFVDASVWYASVVPAEPGHHMANRALAQHAGDLITTDYLLDETLTLLRARRLNHRALALGHVLMSERRARLIYLERHDITAAWDVFHRYSDKEWSFTDCTSKVVMERLGISTALTFDHHFRQFGNLTVLP